MASWLAEGAANEMALSALVEALRAGAALALVGAGTSARVGYPLWGALLDRMAARILELSPLAEPTLQALAGERDLLWRAEEYRRLLGDDGYAAFIRATFGPEEAPFDAFHQDLLRLPFRHVLTTNYDAVLEQAHAAAFPRSRAVTVAWDEAQNVRELIQRIGDPSYGRRYVYLHGRFDDPTSIVLTERDYSERYARAQDTWAKLFALLATQRLVSVGFSLSDLDVMAIFRKVKALMGPGEPRHFAVLPLDGPDTGVARQRLRGIYGVEPVFYRQTPKHEGAYGIVQQVLGALSPPPVTAAALPPASSRPAPEPIAPRAGYDPRCYVSRELIERQCAAALKEAGSPVVVLGPARYGKTALVRRVMDAACRDDQAAGRQSRAVQVEVAAFAPETLDSFEDFAYELALRLVEAVEGGDDWVELAWKRPGDAAHRLTWLLKKHVLGTVNGRLILSIESVDQLPRFNYAESVFGLLRAWVQDGTHAPLDKLRIIVAVSTDPTLFKAEISQSSFFNAAMHVRLEDLTLDQAKELCGLYRLRWADEDLGALIAVVGGHPYLLRLAMYFAALYDLSVRALLAAAEQDGGIYHDFLRQTEERLGHDLVAVLGRVIANPTARLDAATENRLRGAGVLRWVDGAYRFRYLLYERYFRGACARPA